MLVASYKSQILPTKSLSNHLNGTLLEKVTYNARFFAYKTAFSGDNVSPTGRYDKEN
jgi:hypothetical protein